MPTLEQQAGSAIRPFSAEIGDDALDDLRRRLATTRWPSRELVGDRSQGVQLATLQALCRFWAGEYDGRRVEARLNALPQFTTEIAGVNIHFVHVRSRHEGALPMIMTHGWPGSVIEMIDSVGPLTDPTAHGGTAEDAFDLVLPSLPGYGFSAEPTEIGWNLGRTARAWAELMRRLGYTRYVAQGGDVGAGVTDAMGRLAPEGLVGIHTNLLVPALNDPGALPAETEPERAALAAIKTFQTSGNGYFVEHVHPAADDRLRPARLTRRTGRLDDRPRHRRLLQDLPRLRRRSALGQPHPGAHPRQHHAYWLTGTGASAARSYWEAYGPDAPSAAQALPEVSVPVGFSTFPGEIWRTPRSWAEKSYPTLNYFGEAERGGHFAAWEEPELFATEAAGRVPSAARSPEYPAVPLTRAHEWPRQVPNPMPHNSREADVSTTKDRSSAAPASVERPGQGHWLDGLREGYADIGDVQLHYVEAGRGPLIVLLHGFPEFWYGWRLQIEPLAAAGFRVVAPDMRGYNLSSRPDGVEDYDIEKLADDIHGLIHERGAQSASLVGHDWGGTVAWFTAMNHPEVVDRLAILNAAHPRKLSQGLHHPGQLRKSWYFFFFALPEFPETVVHANNWHFFRHFLRDADPAYTPQEFDRYVEAWSQPGAATGMINYYRSSVRTPSKKAEAAIRPLTPPPWSSGVKATVPRSGTGRARPRRRAQPRPGRASARRVALGPSRPGAARHPTADRLLRSRPASPEPMTGDEPGGGAMKSRSAKSVRRRAATSSLRVVRPLFEVRRLL